MKKFELVYNEILHNCYELKNNRFTQNQLSEELGISLSTVSNALLPLKKINVVKVNPMNFVVLEPHKILLFWATKRRFESDIFYRTRFSGNASDAEKLMPEEAIFAAYSAFKLRFSETPADYGEVYVYAEKKWDKRFPESKAPPNVFFLKKEKRLEKYGRITTLAHTFVDLWNINTWYAQGFLKRLEAILGG